MKITVPDGVLRGMVITPEEALLDLAIGMYIDNRATLGQAAHIAGMPQPRFLQELGKRKIPVHYDIEDFRADMEVVREL